MINNNLSTLWTHGLSPINHFRREMDHLLNDFLDTKLASQNRLNEPSEWVPSCEIEEQQNHYLLTLEIPGVQKDQIKLELMDNILTVSGQKIQSHQNRSGEIWYSERRIGKFERSFSLPPGIDAEKVDAQYQDGTLQIVIPKAESSKPRQIKIGSGSGLFSRLIGQSNTKEKEDSKIKNEAEDQKRAS